MIQSLLQHSVVRLLVRLSFVQASRILVAPCFFSVLLIRNYKFRCVYVHKEAGP